MTKRRERERDRLTDRKTEKRKTEIEEKGDKNVEKD